MAISRVSDLPEIVNEWGTQPIDPTDKLAKSFIEVSLAIDDAPGRYESKSIKCNTLKDYIVQNIGEHDEYENTVVFHNGIELSGHVGINENTNDNDIQDNFGIYAKGMDNAIEAIDSNSFVAKNTTTIQSMNVDIAATQQTNIQADGAITLQSDKSIYTNALETFIASDVSTIIASGAPSNTMFAVGQTIAESIVPLYAPTPFDDIGSGSTQVVNVEYLNGKYKDDLSAAIKDEILAILNQQEGGDEPDPQVEEDYMSAYSAANKLFELRTLDYILFEDESPLVARKKKMWLLGQTIANADVIVPNAYSILSTPREQDPTFTDNYGAIQITGYYDKYNHKVVDETMTPHMSTIIDKYGAFWYYTLKSDKTLILPTNNVFFRSGGVDAAAGEFVRAHFPKLNTAAPSVRDTAASGYVNFHVKYNGSSVRYIKNTVTTPVNIESADSDAYILNQKDVVSPPSVQTYTYMVLF